MIKKNPNQKSTAKQRQLDAENAAKAFSTSLLLSLKIDQSGSMPK